MIIAEDHIIHRKNGFTLNYIYFGTPCSYTIFYSQHSGTVEGDLYVTGITGLSEVRLHSWKPYFLLCLGGLFMKMFQVFMCKGLFTNFKYDKSGGISQLNLFV